MRRLLVMVVLLVAAWPAQAAIDWVTSYESGLDEAERQGRPALLYFDAGWCSWCHRWLEGALADPRVAALIEQRFVPIKVDYDARPDLVERYRVTGLPFTAVVEADGAVRLGFVGLVATDDLLRRLEDEVGGRRDAELRLAAFPPIRPASLDEAGYAVFEEAFLEALERLYDAEREALWGLFETGLSLKWPQPMTWLWLEERGLWPERHRAARQGEVARLWDGVDGGFFLYRDVTPPLDHLETAKLLEPNAWMTAWLSNGSRRETRHAAASALLYIHSTLREHGTGGLFQAQRADAAYYALPAAERLRREPPVVDPVQRADSNGLAVVALACAVRRGAPQRTVLDLATGALDFLLEEMVEGGRLYHYREAGQLTESAFALDLFAVLAAGLALDALQPEAGWLARLQPIAEQAADWLAEADEAVWSNRLAGWVAWVAVQARFDLPEGSVERALQQLSLGAETLPDELIPGLAAWRLRLQPERLSLAGCWGR